GPCQLRCGKRDNGHIKHKTIFGDVITIRPEWGKGVGLEAQATKERRAGACGRCARERRRTPAGHTMTSSLLFMIVDDTVDRAENLKELIEFMDVPQVRVALPENWRSRIGDSRLAAVFLSDDLDGDRLRRLIADVGEHDPNVPIV